MTCVILGAGGLAREVYWHIRNTYPSFYKFIFVDDVTDRTNIEIGKKIYPVEKNWSFDKYETDKKYIKFTVGVGDTSTRMKMVEKALETGLTPLPTIIHPSAVIQDPDCRIGRGGFIGPNCTLTTNIKIGDYVTLNLNTTVGHDAVIEDYVNCAPSCSVSGNVHLKNGVSLGTGTVVREKIFIASFVTSGAQSCIVKNIMEDNVTVVGIPAQILKRNWDYASIDC
jgi:sugar O-acyltransferase (sialic acid O-acetyltransferase NeuD family)